MHEINLPNVLNIGIKRETLDAITYCTTCENKFSLDMGEAE